MSSGRLASALHRVRSLRWLPALLLAVPVVLAWATFRWVSLIPQIDQRFFFTPGSPIYRAHQKIEQRYEGYEGQELLVVIAAAPDISTRDYRRRIERLGHRLLRVQGVTNVRSIAAGPDGLEDARESPLWHRLLLPEGGHASNLILVVSTRNPPQLIGGVRAVLRQSRAKDFRLELAGVPFVVDSIRSNLQRDFRTFNLAAVGVFALVIVALFRSVSILLGSLAACGTAALATLLVQQWLGGRIGLLTANIVTIAFVLTQSHVVFMSNNWRKLRASSSSPERAVRRALSNTIKASVWCMCTALLGFGSLLYVEAQPLRELGFGGVIATVVALASAYLIFPPFLLWARAPTSAKPLGGRDALPRRWLAACILALCLAMGAGALRLDTDPSLLAYFGAHSDVRRSLELVDRHGGSSPLNIAVRRKDGERLDTRESYERMWKLQRALQDDPAVGTVLSLPVLMAEANRSPLAKLLTWNWLLDILSRPEFDRVAEGFVNKQRNEALFMLRMVENGRTVRRTDVVARLHGIVRKHGFEPALTGGIYALQGRLADLVADSLYEGLAILSAICTVIALVLTRSLSAGLAMAACTVAIPAVTLGLAGFARVPLDIVVTPAINVAVGVAVDSMIHLGAAWRRARARGEDVRAARREQAPGIVAFFFVVAAGFSIFLLSNFPPTQRFGLVVVLGTAIAAVMALWIFPALLASAGREPAESAEPRPIRVVATAAPPVPGTRRSPRRRSRS